MIEVERHRELPDSPGVYLFYGEKGELLYDVRSDPDLEHSLAAERPEVCRELLALAVQDAGGSIPAEFSRYQDKPGCTPFEDRSSSYGRIFKK